MNLILPTIARKRASYEKRAGIHTRAARALAAAVSQPAPFIEDEDGWRVRQWKTEEMSSYTHADIAKALTGAVAVEHNQLLEQIPPSAIKYAVTKGWLVKDAIATFYRVTLRGANELALPSQVHGRRIRFLRA